MTSSGIAANIRNVDLSYESGAVDTSESMQVRTDTDSFAHLSYGNWLNESTEQSFVFYASDNYVSAGDLPVYGSVNFSGTAVFNWYQGSSLLLSGTEHGMELTADFFNDSVAIQFETESYSSGVNVNQYINPYDGMSQDYLADTNALRVNTQNISINRGTGGFDGTFVSLGDCPGCVEPLPPGFTYNGTINGAFTGSGEAAPKGAVGLINIENGDINAVGSFGTLKQ